LFQWLDSVAATPFIGRPHLAAGTRSAADADVPSGFWLMIDVAAVVDVQDVDYVGGLVDAVDDPVGSAAGAVAPGERAEQRLAGAVGTAGESSITEPALTSPGAAPRARPAARYVAASSATSPGRSTAPSPRR
jgi:hypothetical protein